MKTSFPVVANTRTKSIQKQIKNIDVDKVGSRKPLASKIVFRVELAASSFFESTGCRLKGKKTVGPIEYEKKYIFDQRVIGHLH